MDFAGQKLAEQLYYYIILLFAALGFVLGYIKQDFDLAVVVVSVGFGVVAVICLPDWPCFNRNPLPWRLPAVDPSSEVAAPGDAPTGSPGGIELSSLATGGGTATSSAKTAAGKAAKQSAKAAKT